MQMVKSKRFKGIYLRKQVDGDIALYFTYKNDKGNVSYKKVGLRSQGITEQYAYDKRSETILLMKNGEVPQILARNKGYKTTLNDIAEFYFTHHKTKSTEKRKRQYSNRIQNVLGDMNIYSIAPKNILQLQQILENNGLGASTIIQYTELVGTMFSYYSKQTNTKLNNPTLNIHKPSVQNRRERVLSKDELDMLFSEIQSDFTLSIFFALALTTAARKSTILNYKIKDINMQEKTLLSYDFKNESSYKSFLDDKTIKLIKLRISQCNGEANSPIVFKPDIKDLGRWISREAKIVLDNLFNQGLSPNDRKNRVVIHTMRHTVLSHLGRQGSNIFLLQKISNHKSINMVARYTKLVPYRPT
ncbi:tyrosine-type recombinase/integrase [Sulfurimonas sp.]|uniref:tyrosine-type recombinase/integrase n=1 Tax=Sulfurimonas sp. TaxID=2022749 RepID=UPI003D107C92